MARDIEEFLRKAAERRKQQQAGKQGQSAPPRTPDRAAGQPGNVNDQPWKRQPPRERSAQPEIIEVVEVVDDQIIEAQPVTSRRPPNSDSRRQSVSSQVQSHIDTSKFDRGAQGLGSLKARMTDDVDEVKEKFDRDAKKFVSRHTSRDNTDSDIVGANVSAIATDLIDMLRDPKSIRQAILVSEILRRPDFDDES